MNILYLLKHAPDQTIRNILDNQKSEHAVTVVDLGEDKDYDRIVDLIVSSDRIMSW
jgi:galactitol-specific phosphotransferase system IIB component